LILRENFDMKQNQNSQSSILDVHHFFVQSSGFYLTRQLSFPVIDEALHNFEVLILGTAPLWNKVRLAAHHHKKLTFLLEGLCFLKNLNLKAALDTWKRPKFSIVIILLNKKTSLIVCIVCSLVKKVILFQQITSLHT